MESVIRRFGESGGFILNIKHLVSWVVGALNKDAGWIPAWATRELHALHSYIEITT